VYNGKLFNTSMVMAGNETDEDFRKNTIVDIYDLTTGSYYASIYIPAYENEKMTSFKVIGNRIIAMYKSNIVLYDYKEHL
jgi:hypothetical protein